MRAAALASLLVLACASPPPEETPRCWRMSGTGEIGQAEDGYLCVLLRGAECWSCIEAPIYAPDETE